MSKKKADNTEAQQEPITRSGKYRVQFDFDYSGTPGKLMSKETVTQPDMNLTVRQLLENHTRGIDSQVQERKPLYFDIEVPTIHDITDVMLYKEHLEEKLKQTAKFIEDDIAAAAAEKRAKEKLPSPIENGELQPPLEQTLP